MSEVEKAIVKTDCADDSIELKRKAAALNIETIIIADAGHNEIFSGTKTVLAIDPTPTNPIDQVTGYIALF